MDVQKANAGAQQSINDAQMAADRVNSITSQITGLLQQAQLADMRKDTSKHDALYREALRLKRELVNAHANYTKAVYVAQLVNAAAVLAQQGNQTAYNVVVDGIKKLNGRQISVKLPPAPKPTTKAPPPKPSGRVGPGDMNAQTHQMAGLGSFWDDVGSAFGTVGSAIGDAASWVGSNIGTIGGVVGGVVGAVTGTPTGAAIGSAIATGSAVVNHIVNAPTSVGAPQTPYPSGVPNIPRATAGVPSIYSGTGAPPTGIPFAQSGGQRPILQLPPPGQVPVKKSWLAVNWPYLAGGGLLLAAGGLILFEKESGSSHRHSAPALPAPAAA